MDGRARETVDGGGQTGLPRMTTDNSTTPAPHFFRQAGGPQKRINHHLSCLLGFMCLLLDRSLRKRKRGGVYVPFRSSVAAHVSSFARS